MSQHELSDEEWIRIQEMRRAAQPVRHMLDTLAARPDRDVYEGAGGGCYYITYQGGEVSRAAIDEALSKGLIKERYPGKSVPCWILARQWTRKEETR